MHSLHRQSSLEAMAPQSTPENTVVHVDARDRALRSSHKLSVGDSTIRLKPFQTQSEQSRYPKKDWSEISIGSCNSDSPLRYSLADFCFDSPFWLVWNRCHQHVSMFMDMRLVYSIPHGHLHLHVYLDLEIPQPVLCEHLCRLVGEARYHNSGSQSVIASMRRRCVWGILDLDVVHVGMLSRSSFALKTKSTPVSFSM